MSTSAIGFKLYFLTVSSMAKSTKDASSLIPDELPAVKFLKTGRNFDSVFIDVEWGCSSVSNADSSLSVLKMIGKISSLIRPDSISSSQLWIF